MKQYTNKENVEKYLQRELTFAEDAILEGVIATVSEDIAAYLNRNYINIGGSTPTATTRYFTGQGGNELFVDDFTSITSVELLDAEGNDYLTFTNTYLQYHPLNSTVYESIVSTEARFTRRIRGVAVTGVFTSGPLPSPIIAAASILTGLYFTTMKQQGVELKKESIEGYSYERFSTLDYIAQKDMYLGSLQIYQRRML